jgi:NADH:ubiquinone oxidoreductase subunit 6 (subunit J)
MPIGVFVGSLFLFEVLCLSNPSTIVATSIEELSSAAFEYNYAFLVSAPSSGLESLGLFLYGNVTEGTSHEYLILTAYILLLAMVGAIKLTLRTRKSKHQGTYEQVSASTVVRLMRKS